MSQTLEERREQAGGHGGAAGVRAEGNEGGTTAASRAREGRAQLRTGGGGRGGGRGFARGLGTGRFGAGAVEAVGPHAGRLQGQVRVGRLRLQQAGFLADSEKMADERPSWLPDGLVLLPLLQLHNISAMFGVVRIGLNCVDIYVVHL